MRFSHPHIFLQSTGIAALLLMGLTAPAQSQQVTATLTVQDSLVDVGKPFAVTMSISHPEDVVVIFPDSAAEFSPFELVRTTPFPTATVDGVSRDEAVYELYTWAIETQQAISLPYQVVKAGDTTEMMSAEATFAVRELIPQVSDTMTLKLIKNIQPISEPFNWRAFAFFMSLFLLIVALCIYFLRKPILRWMRRRRVEREWQPILLQLRQIEQLRDNQIEFIRKLNRVWKLYIDRNRTEAFTSLTTTELRSAIQRFETLRPADRELLARSSQMADFILFIDIRMSGDDLQRLYAEVFGIMEREYRRRKEAAEA